MYTESSKAEHYSWIHEAVYMWYLKYIEMWGGNPERWHGKIPIFKINSKKHWEKLLKKLIYQSSSACTSPQVTSVKTINIS